MEASKLLYHSEPRTFSAELASLIGINEAIVVQQFYFWARSNEKLKRNYHEGHYWTWNTQEEWQKQFPWMSVPTIRRTISNLEKWDLIISKQFRKKKWDRTKFYRINHEAWGKLEKLLYNAEFSDVINLITSVRSKRSPQSDRDDHLSIYKDLNKDLLQRILKSKAHGDPCSTSHEAEEKEAEKNKADCHPLRDRDFEAFENSFPVKDRKEERIAPTNGKSTDPVSLERFRAETHETQSRNGRNGKKASSAVLEAVPVATQKTRAKKPNKQAHEFTWDDEEIYLQFPKASSLAVHRLLATRIVQGHLILDWMSDDFEVDDEDGDWYFCNLRMNPDEYFLEGEFFAQEGGHALAALRNYTASLYDLSSGVYNEMLEEAWEEATEFIKDYGIEEAKKLATGNGVIQYFCGE